MSFSKFVSLPGHNIQITAKSCLQVVLPITGGKFTLSTHICLMAWGTVAKLLIISAHLPCVPSWMRRQHAPKGSTTGNCRTRKRMHGKHYIRWNPLKSKTTNLHRWPTCDHVSCFIRAILQEKRWRLLNREVLLLSKFLQLILKLFGMCQQFVARDLALLKAISLAQSLICSDVNLVSNCESGLLDCFSNGFNVFLHWLELRLTASAWSKDQLGRFDDVCFLPPERQLCLMTHAMSSHKSRIGSPPWLHCKTTWEKAPGCRSKLQKKTHGNFMKSENVFFSGSTGSNSDFCPSAPSASWRSSVTALSADCCSRSCHNKCFRLTLPLEQCSRQNSEIEIKPSCCNRSAIIIRSLQANKNIRQPTPVSRFDLSFQFFILLISARFLPKLSSKKWRKNKTYFGVLPSWDIAWKYLSAK